MQSPNQIPTQNQFQYYKNLAEQTFAQLTDEQLFWRPNDQSNSIAMIVKHLSGNMLSRWTDFLSTDGEKVWRNRDAEFEDDITTRKEMMTRWNQGWNCLLTTISTLTEEDLSKEIYIRNLGHSVVEAINRQLSHYPYHIGQIVYIGKMLSENWTSLSIPIGTSAAYNSDKLKLPKRTQHFTEEYLKEE